MSFLPINPEYKKDLFIPASVTALAVGALFAPLESVKIIGLTILTGVSYKACNNLISCRKCIEYFTIDHQYAKPRDGNKHLEKYISFNPITTAVFFGMKETWLISTLAGMTFAFLARVPFSDFKRKISALEIAKVIIPTALFFGILAHIESNTAKKQMTASIQPSSKHPTKRAGKFVSQANANTKPGSFCHKDFPGVPEKLLPEWAACHARDQTSAIGLAAGALFLSIGIVATRRGLFFNANQL